MSFQAYLDNIEAKTGKTAEEFKRLARKKGLVEYKDVIAWLKEDFGWGWVTRERSCTTSSPRLRRPFRQLQENIV